MNIRKIMRRASLMVLALVMAGGAPLSAGAQQAPARESLPCFDFYPYMALKIDASLKKDIYAPGESAQLTLNVYNDHSRTSVAGAKALLQIRKYTPGSTETVLLQEIDLGGGLNYPHGQNSTNNLTFTVPAWLPNGIYQGSVTITENGYHIAGLPFTQDNVGPTFAFQVDDEGNKNPEIAFIKEAQATINGVNASPFKPAIRVAEENIPATLVVPVVNPGAKQVSGTLTAELYAWDETRDKLAGESRQVIVSANGQTSFEFTTPAGLSAGTYMMRLRYEANGQSAIAKIRFSVPGIVPDVFYSNVVVKDGVVETVSCVGNSAPPVGDLTAPVAMPEGKVVVSVVDPQSGKVLSSGEQTGLLYPALEPKLYRNKVAADMPAMVTLKTDVYDAAGNLLMSKQITTANPVAAGQSKGGLLWYTIIALIVVVGGGIGAAVWYWKNKNTHMPTVMIVLFAVASAAGLVATQWEQKRDIVNAQSFVNAPSASAVISSMDIGGGTLTVTGSFGIDYIAPSTVKGGDVFTITKINQGEVTEAFTSCDEPPAKFYKNEARAEYHSENAGRDMAFSFPYADAWTSDNDGVIACVTVDENTARCTVDINKSANFSSAGTPVRLAMNRVFSPMPAGGSESLNRTKTIMVKSAKPIVDLRINGNASPVALEVPNTAATLSWTIENEASSCQLTGSLNQAASHDASNSLSLGTLTRGTAMPGSGKTYSYTMVCTSPEGLASDPKTVSATVWEYPKCSAFSIDPDVITLPDSATATWSCNYVNRCEITNNKDASVMGLTVTGKQSAGEAELRPTASTQYTMSCNGLDGTTTLSDSVQIEGEDGTRIREDLP